MKTIFYSIVILLCSYTVAQAQPLVGTSWRGNQSLRTALGNASSTTVDSVIMYFNSSNEFQMRIFTPDTTMLSNGVWWQVGTSDFKFVDTGHLAYLSTVCNTNDTASFTYTITTGTTVDTLNVANSTDQCSFRGAAMVGAWYGSMKPSNVPSVVAAADGIAIYPNPSPNVLNVTIGTQLKGAMQATLYDMQGRACKQMILSGASNTSVNISDLASGMYILDITADNVKGHYKILKQ